jgi:AcrR family transcriptional regulator
MVQTSAAASAASRGRLEPNGPAADFRRREILAAASKLFRNHGLQAAGMREIAAEAGMTAGNLYYYFADKQALLAFCQETTLDALLAEAHRIVGEARPPADRLRALLVAHVVCLNETHPGSLAHLEVEALAGPRRGALLRKRKEYEQLIERLVSTGMAEGAFRPVPARLPTLALLGALNWTVKWFDPAGSKSAREVGEEFAELFLRGLEVAPRA